MTTLSLDDKLKIVEPLLGFIAHKLNNSLAVINGYMELLKKSCSDDEPALNKLDKINQSADQINQVLMQLLLLSDRGLLNRSEIDFAEFYNSIVENIREILDDRLLVTENKISRIINLDVEQLKVVLLALFKTFDHSTYKKSKVIMLSRQVGSGIELNFKISGLGINANELDDYFDPFTKKSEELKSESLIILLLYSLVKKHNGSINVCLNDNNEFCINIIFENQ